MSRVGELLDGKYEVLRVLGRGGMGEVYVARHKLIGKDVAIKFLRPDLTSDHDAVTRFAQEARAAAAVGHRGIVDIYDIGTSPDGAPYLVMELLDGESFRSVLERHRKLPVDPAVAIVTELLSALVAAHAKGIVHRDLKPDNVFVERTDGPLSIKLLDFGIAKMTEGAGVHVTRTGFPLGTAQYMSPEQARGERDLDARVDIWSVGVMLYEALTGRLPFIADNYNALIVALLRDEAPKPRSLEPDLPADVEAVVMRAMDKDRERRFGSATELLAALRPFGRIVDVSTLRLGPTGPVVIPSPSDVPSSPTAATIPAAEVPAPSAPFTTTGALRGRRRSVRAALAVGLALLGLGGVWTLSRTSQSSPVVPATEAPARPPRARVDAGRAARPPGPRIVTVTLEGAPRDARVYLDGALVTELPIRIAPRATMIPLRVEAEGFQTSSQMILPEHDMTVRVALTADAAPEPQERTRRPHGGQQKVAPPPTTGPSGSHVTKIQRDTREFDK